jgi:DNA invertase Pin-like site-specific DNA recombinase
MRVIVAARLSRLQKDGREGIGIETQDARSREWAEREGHDVVDVVADTRSGTVAPWDRANLKPWVTEPALLARYDAVVAYKTDRLGRGTQEDFTRIEHWATEHGKRLVIVDGPQYPARDDSDYWQWAATKRGARKEWEDDRERSMRAQRELRQRGKLVGRYPWGYASDGAKYDRAMVIDWSLSYLAEDGQRVHYVQAVYRRIAAGETLATVAAWLAEQTGRDWWPRTVASLVRNPTYRGSHQDATGREIHRCEPLVTGEEWEDAVANLDARPKRGSRTSGTSSLSGALRCARCSSPMYKITCGSGNQARVAYYRCSGRGPQRRGCGNMIRLDVADALVDEVMGMLTRPRVEWQLIKGHGYDADITDVNLKLRDLVSQGLSEDAEDAARAELRAERARLRALPAVPDTWIPVELDTTYADEWRELAPGARRAWLKRYASGVWLGRPGMAWARLWSQQPGEYEPGQDEDDGTLEDDDGIASTTVTRDGAWLSITWAPLESGVAIPGRDAA